MARRMASNSSRDLVGFCFPMGRAAPLCCPGGEVRSCSLLVAALLALAWTSHLYLSLTPRNLALARARLLSRRVSGVAVLSRRRSMTATRSARTERSTSSFSAITNACSSSNGLVSPLQKALAMRSMSGKSVGLCRVMAASPCRMVLRLARDLPAAGRGPRRRFRLWLGPSVIFRRPFGILRRKVMVVAHQRGGGADGPR
jgi:hypothetical protein